MKSKIKNLLSIISIIVIIIAISASIIFVLDINNSRGLIPLIFISLTIYFLFYMIVDILDATNKKTFTYDASVLLFLMMSLVGSIISIFVFWV